MWVDSGLSGLICSSVVGVMNRSTLLSLLTSSTTETASASATAEAATTTTSSTSTCGSRWLDEETKTLISLWGAENIQCQLDGAVRNKTIYEKLSKEMKDHGYTRDWVQCKNKIKN